MRNTKIREMLKSRYDIGKYQTSDAGRTRSIPAMPHCLKIQSVFWGVLKWPTGSGNRSLPRFFKHSFYEKSRWRRSKKRQKKKLMMEMVVTMSLPVDCLAAIPPLMPKYRNCLIMEYSEQNWKKWIPDSGIGICFVGTDQIKIKIIQFQ